MMAASGTGEEYFGYMYLYETPYLSGSELHPPANRRVWRRRLKTHGLPVGGLDILRNKNVSQREGNRWERLPWNLKMTKGLDDLQTNIWQGVRWLEEPFYSFYGNRNHFIFLRKLPK